MICEVVGGGAKGIDFWRGSETLIVLKDGDEEEIAFGRGWSWCIRRFVNSLETSFAEGVPFGLGGRKAVFEWFRE